MTAGFRRSPLAMVPRRSPCTACERHSTGNDRWPVITLLDVNVLVAIAWPEQSLHDVAIAWFESRSDQGWATCPITESGFMRISANANVVGYPVRPTESAALLVDLRSVGSHQFWVDDVEPSTSSLIPRDRLIGHRQVTDAHLLALARRHGGSVATLDRGLATLARGLDGAQVEIVSNPSS